VLDPELLDFKMRFINFSMKRDGGLSARVLLAVILGFFILARHLPRHIPGAPTVIV
jgi:hypothetical protein